MHTKFRNIRDLEQPPFGNSIFSNLFSRGDERNWFRCVIKDQEKICYTSCQHRGNTQTSTKFRLPAWFRKNRLASTWKTTNLPLPLKRNRRPQMGSYLPQRVFAHNFNYNPCPLTDKVNKETIHASTPMASLWWASKKSRRSKTQIHFHSL